MEVVAAGDALLTRRIVSLEETLGPVRDLMTRADIGFANLEMAVPAFPPTPAVLARGSHALGRPSALGDLSWMGVDVVNFANNHVMDFSERGALDAIGEIGRAGLAFAGAGRTLGEARAPAFVDTPAGRFALIGVSSSNSDTSLAADPGPLTTGRAGISPLRFTTEYHVTAEQFRQLQAIDEDLGTAEARRILIVTSRSRAMDGQTGPARAGALPFAGRRFVVGDRPGVVTHPHPGDLDAITRSVEFARSQADVVAVSIHCHESAGDGWNSPEPPTFLAEACHRWIDAGADVILGHGPHQMRGVEVYGGRPILYSMGNFFFTNETRALVPPEAYEKQGLDPQTATVTDYGQAALGGGFGAHEQFWQAVLARLVFDGGRAELDLVPLTLSRQLPPHQRGLPQVASGEVGAAILDRIEAMSSRYGTTFKPDPSGQHARATIPIT
jgi:poly-gamma-glutamate capsule biosynthesis protein CapA/YwtB (metallophosphatase superfamily)